MTRTIRWAGLFLVLFAVNLGSLDSVKADGFLSGTYLDPALQRQDILSHHLWKSWPEHRYSYNRPRYVGGHIAHVIEPTSQEAMSWQSSVKNGHYQNHAGRCVPQYLYPKPWEALNTKARPDFRQVDE